jgi:hypothetical protein
LNAGDYKAIGRDLQKAYESLPGSDLGFPPRNVTPGGANRVGVLEIGAFYQEFTGRAEAPRTLMEWLHTSEEGLAAATNGMVFRDPAGDFTALRERLLSYYPEDVRIKKIAARAARMAQSGQYNYARCMRRGEIVAARLSLGEFICQTISMCYLLCRAYTPYYKWAHRGLRALPLSPCIYEGLAVLAETGAQSEKWVDSSRWAQGLNAADDNVAAIENICLIIREELVKQNLTEGADDFLETHAHKIMRRIADPVIRERMIMEG